MEATSIYEDLLAFDLFLIKLFCPFGHQESERSRILTQIYEERLTNAEKMIMITCIKDDPKIKSSK